MYSNVNLRECMSCFRARVISFSANGRSCLAFGRVVMIRSSANKDVAMFRSIIKRCPVFFPNLPRLFRWRMIGLLYFHSQRKAHAFQHVLDLLQGLTSEMFCLQ